MDSRIKVAQIIGKCSEGGVESIIMNLYRSIDHTKVVFDFFVENESLIINKKEIESYGGHVYFVPKYSKIHKFKKCLYKHFKENNYDIVHANMNAQSFLALGAAKKAGVKIRIAHSHTTSNKKEHIRHLIKQFLRLFSKTNSTHYFACSEKAGAWLFGKKTLNAGQITIINNAINVDKFKYDESSRNKIRKMLNVGESTFVVGHIGRFMKQKNHAFLIDLFNNVYQKNHNYKLCLIGTGPLEEEIRNKVKKLGLKHAVIFVGPVANANEYYNAFDCFALPSLYEGLPVVGIEAQINGLRCLFSDQITKEACISDYTKYLPIIDDEIWAKEILDSEINERTTNVNFAKYDIKVEAAKLLQIYQNLVK